MSNLTFEEMNLSYEIINAVKDMGFEEATPIQSQAIEKQEQAKQRLLESLVLK